MSSDFHPRLFYGTLLLTMIVVGCSTHKESTSVDLHYQRTLLLQLDSIISSRTVIQQDSAWRETIMRQFQSIREHSDTSHTQVVDTAGRVIRETTIIHTEKEVTSETNRQEREFLLLRLHVMDSTLQVMQHQLTHTDSVLQQQAIVKKEPPTLSERVRLRLFDYLLAAFVALFVIAFLRLKMQSSKK